MSFQITGVLKAKFDTEQISEKFTKRDFVVETSDDKYPQTILLQFQRDKCSLLDAYNVGQTVEVSFNLRGKEYTKNGETKYFNTLDAWKIYSAQGNNSPRQETNISALKPNAEFEKPQVTPLDDDLPF